MSSQGMASQNRRVSAYLLLIIYNFASHPPIDLIPGLGGAGEAETLTEVQAKAEVP